MGPIEQVHEEADAVLFISIVVKYLNKLNQHTLVY